MVMAKAPKTKTNAYKLGEICKSVAMLVAETS